MHQNCSCNTSPPNLSSLRSPDTRVVPNNNHIYLNPRCSRLFNRHTKVQYIARIIHNHDQDTLVFLHAVQYTSPHLLSTRRREDRACDGSGKKTGAYERRETGLMA